MQIQIGNVSIKDMTEMIKTLANLDFEEMFRLCLLFLVFSIGVSIIIHGINLSPPPQVQVEEKPIIPDK